MDFVIGDRSTQSGKELWIKINNIETERYYTDYWKPYAEFIPKHKHTQSKAETYTIEGYNSRIRHYLARFKRKSKCYTKKVYMMEYSLRLLFHKLNNSLSIISY